jgi:hypothetical protein
VCSLPVEPLPERGREMVVIAEAMIGRKIVVNKPVNC